MECINCGRTEDEVKFYQEGVRPWQYCQRCIECEALYVEEFLRKYPNTKTRYKFKKLTPNKENLRRQI